MTSSSAAWPRSRWHAVAPALLTWIVSRGWTPGAYVLASVCARTLMADPAHAGVAVGDADRVGVCVADGVLEAEWVACAELVFAAAVDDWLPGPELDDAVGLPLSLPSRPKSHHPPATTATRRTR